MPKNLLIIFTLLLIIVIILVTPKIVRAEKVTVGATVDEHLSYLKIGDRLTFSTNSPSGLFIKNKNGGQRIYGPIEIVLKNNAKDFILVTNF